MFAGLFVPLFSLFLFSPIRFLSGLRALVGKEHLILFVFLPFICLCFLVVSLFYAPCIPILVP